MMRPSKARYQLVALSVLLLVAGALGATVVSSSKLETCYRDSATSTDADSGLDCDTKLVLQLSIDQSDAGTTELQAFVQGVNSNGSSYTLEDPITVKMYKTPVVLVYPLIYARTVNSKPYEVVYQKGWSLNPPPCYDGTSSKSTCGWYTNSTGAKILYSNGFCCRCGWDNVFHKDDITRGSLDCNPFGHKMSSGHCLRMSTSWWDMYSINPYTMVYSLTFEISGGGIKVPYNITMDQSTPFMVSPEGFVSGRIIGDFPSATAPPNFDSFMLASMATINDPIFTGRENNWMIVPTNMVDLSGSTCNKIGVSFEAFYSQPQRCGVVAGTCLNNQLADLFAADDALRAVNKTPTYLLPRYGTFVPSLDNTYFTLQYHPTGISNTLVALNIKADSVKVVTNRSTGKIASATVENFTTFSRDGIIHVTAVNTGTLTASYSLTITECTTLGILAVPAQASSIGPFMSWSTSFNLYAQNLFSSQDHCLVSLYDSSDAVIDTVIVYFNTTMYIPDYGSQGGNATNTGTASFSSDSTTCSSLCPVFWNILCYFLNWGTCSGRFWSFVITCIILVFIVLAALKTQCCGAKKAIKKCGSGSKKKKNNSGGNGDNGDNDGDDDKKSFSQNQDKSFIDDEESGTQKKSSEKKTFSPSRNGSTQPRAGPPTRKSDASSEFDVIEAASSTTTTTPPRTPKRKVHASPRPIATDEVLSNKPNLEQAESMSIGETAPFSMLMEAVEDEEVVSTGTTMKRLRPTPSMKPQ